MAIKSKRERKVTITEPVEQPVEQLPPVASEPEPEPVTEAPVAAEPASVPEPPASEPEPESVVEAPVDPEPEPAPAPVEQPAPAAPAPRKRLLNARPGVVLAGPLTFGPGDCIEVSDDDLLHPRVQRALAVGLLVVV